MTKKFVEEVKKKTDNNDYAVDNNYYNTYLRDRYASLKDSNKDLSYLESPEYSDMELFLTVAKELGIEVEVIIFPVMVNGMIIQVSQERCGRKLIKK